MGVCEPELCLYERRVERMGTIVGGQRLCGCSARKEDGRRE
jgi:hypothetical protein